MPALLIRFAISSLLVFTLFLTGYSQPRDSKDGVMAARSRGSVSGKLVASGLVNLSGVKVTLLGPDNSTNVLSQTTGGDGSFVFYEILPGIYSIEIDAATLPQKYSASVAETIEVKAGSRVATAVMLDAHRSLVGHAFVDIDGDGIYSPGKDAPVAGAQVAVGGRFVVSGSDGSYRINGLPAGRMSLIANASGSDHTTQVVFDLGPGPVTDRIVNVPLYR
jgi:hypothetical protein